MTTPYDPMDPEGKSPQWADEPGPNPGERNIPIVAMVASVAALIVAVIALVLVLDDDETTVDTSDTTSTTAPSTTATDETTTSQSADSTTSAPTTSEPTTTESTTTLETTTSTTIDPGVYRPAVWPWPDAAAGPAASRFQDPVEAAASFATDFVGFDDPIVGEFLQGDSRSGEVEVRSEPDGAVTTVFVRQLGSDDSWWVLGAATGDIRIETPDAFAVLDGELRVEGEARTFEGNVEVILRADGQSDPLVEGNVTGRGDGQFGAFDETFTFDPPAARSGAALFVSNSARDGTIWQAGVVRIYFEE